MLTRWIDLITYSALSGFFIFFAIIDNFSIQKLPTLLFLFLVFILMMNEIRYRCKDEFECLSIKPLKENTGQMFAVLIRAAAIFLLAKTVFDIYNRCIMKYVKALVNDEDIVSLRVNRKFKCAFDYYFLR